MKRLDSSLITPIYVKDNDHLAPSRDPVYYLLASNGLFLCRNHPHYQSCVRAPQWPTELTAHRASLVWRYPPIPQDQLERICGFFGHISETYNAEAIALLAWDQADQVIRTIVPPQVAAVGQTAWGSPCPIAVKYRFPRTLPRHWTVFCDIHSHGDLAAYASQTDIDDEEHFTGLHIVVGRLHQEPPDFHAEGVVDGTRFEFAWDEVIAGYERRLTFPAEWLDQITITNEAAYRRCEFADDEQESRGAQ